MSVHAWCKCFDVQFDGKNHAEAPAEWIAAPGISEDEASVFCIRCGDFVGVGGGVGRYDLALKRPLTLGST